MVIYLKGNFKIIEDKDTDYITIIMTKQKLMVIGKMIN